MTKLVSWNIQNGKGVDDVVSLSRIASVIRDLCDPDIICLQEISRNLSLVGASNAPDQVAELAELFPGYEVIFGKAIDAVDDDGQSWQYGNATLTRLPVLSRFHHLLPQPANGTVKHMPRQAIELTVETGNGPLRVVNTHLEFHCEHQRTAQVQRLVDLQVEIAANAERPARHVTEGSYRPIPRPANCVMCGDFNMDVGSPEYLKMTGNETAELRDAWQTLYPGHPHAPTCGVHDTIQWPQGAHCRDFFFITSTLADDIKDLRVNTETDASDHQPLMLQIGAN